MKTTNTPRPGYKTFQLPAHTPLTDQALNQLHDLVINFPAQDLRNTLLELYHAYVMHEHGNLPVNFDEMATHFYCLDNFFKLIGNQKPDADGQESGVTSQ
jgi:hypothetical protein